MELISISRLLQVDHLRTTCLLAATVGFLSHILYFIRGYRVPQTVGIIFTFCACGVILSVLSILTNGLLDGLLVFSVVSGSYIATLSASIVIYRLFLHPLRAFPGPLPAKISKIYNIAIAQHMHEHQNSWVKQYGDIVRIGA